MTVAAQVPITNTLGDGSTKTFLYSFAVLQASDLVVKVAGVAKTLGVDYTQTTSTTGGSVTFTAAPANGALVSIYRSSTLARTTDYQNNGDLLAVTLNGDLDRLWYALQEFLLGGAGFGRVVKAPAGEILSDLPIASVRAGSLLAFDANGQVTVVAVSAQSATQLALDLANAAAAAKGAALVGYSPALAYASGIGQFLNTTFARTALETAAGVTPSNYAYLPGDVRRYGAVGNGSILGQSGTNDSAAFAAAASTGHRVLVDGGLIYRLSANVTIATSFYLGQGATVSIDAGFSLTLNCPTQIVSTVPFYGPGFAILGTAARPARLAAVLYDRAAGAPLRGGGQLDAFGDSFTSGTGVTAATRYPALLASRWNCNENNHGIGGRGWTRANLEAYLGLPKYGSRNRTITCLAGFNDVHYGLGSAKTIAKVASETRAFLANAFLKTAVPADDASVTKTGVWTNATAGTWADKGSQSLGGHAMFSTGNANKIAWTFTGTNVVAAYFQGSNATYTLSTFDVYIDSVFVETISPNNTTDGNLGFPEVYEGLTHAVLVYTGLGGGSHTIELRQTQAANLLAVDYFGTLASPGDCPTVLIGEIPHVNQAGYTSPETGRTKQIDDAASAAMRGEVTTFAALGYPCAFVPVNDYYNYNANIQGDNDHPNVTGHQQIAAAFSAYAYPINGDAMPSCSFTKAAIQTITTATLTAITWSAAVDDFWGFRDSVNTSRIVAPMTGTMRISGMISYVANATGIRTIAAYKNGSGSILRDIAGLVGFLSNPNCMSFSVDFAVVAGDYIELKTSQNSGGNLDIQAQSQIDVCMVR